MWDLGFEIAEEVIARSNCLSKQSISNTNTVSSEPKLFIFTDSDKNGFSFHTLEQKHRLKSLCNPMEEHLLSRHNKIMAHSSCNGLLLIQIDYDLFVWNPLTKFFKEFLSDDDDSWDLVGHNFSSADLCFDSYRDEYKVIVVYKSCPFFAAFGATNWKKIEDPYTIQNVYLGTVFKGKKHWICKSHLPHYDLDEDIFLPEDLIVYFNPHTNMLVELPIPKPKKGKIDTIVGLGVLDSCLCLTHLDDEKIEFVAMTEYGNEDSWVIVFVISNIPNFSSNDVLEPLLKTKEGEVLVSTYMRDRGSSHNIGPSVKSYDVNGNFCKDRLVSTESSSFKVMLYEESWASTRVLEYEKQRNYDFVGIQDSLEEKRKKKKNKKIEKVHHRQMKGKKEHSRIDHCSRTSIKIHTRRKERKGYKKNYESKWEYLNFPSQHDLFSIHEDNLEGETGKTNKIRAPQIYYKSSVIFDSHTTMRGSCCDIVEDLLIDVLSKLPIKSLARFKCVSKQWKHLISNTITLGNVPKLLILSRNKKCFSFHFLNQEIRVESLCNPTEEHLLGACRVKSHSSFNGFVLIQIRMDFVMWNPLTKFYKKVLTLKSLDCYDYYDFLADLCFDYANGEYKVVLMSPYMFWSDKLEFFYVGTCGSNSLEKFEVPKTVRLVFQGPSFKGYKHWFCKGNFSPIDRSFDPPNHIVYFDPSRNEFIEVPMPQHKKGDRAAIMGLGVIDECFCMTCWYDPIIGKGNTEFLVMKDYGNKNSWELLFVISNAPELLDYHNILPLFKTKEGEILVCMHQGRSWSVKAYDDDGNYLRDILLANRRSFKLILYEKSWFSPIKSLEDIDIHV